MSSNAQTDSAKQQGWRKWQCVICGFIYDEAEGWPEDSIAPGTRWDDVPEDWLCPDCGTCKQDFEMKLIL
ncbi:rubredoxin [Kistimonas scapharcae]|uniref:Rubredoxin n=1 Tax=Kistimonas scapharcae TaxID=1036133 RepID=A0ABP8V7A5_9GAMM